MSIEEITVGVRLEEDGSYDLGVWVESQDGSYGASLRRSYRPGAGPDQVCWDAARLLDSWRVGGLIALEAEASDIRFQDLY